MSAPLSLSAKAVVLCSCQRVLGRQTFSSSSSACARAGSSQASTSKTRETGGRHAARDEDGNPIGRDNGPLYREWLSTIGAPFKEPKLHATNWLGRKVVGLSFWSLARRTFSSLVMQAIPS